MLSISRYLGGKYHFWFFSGTSMRWYWYCMRGPWYFCAHDVGAGGLPLPPARTRRGQLRGRIVAREAHLPDVTCRTSTTHIHRIACHMCDVRSCEIPDAASRESDTPDRQTKIWFIAVANYTLSNSGLETQARSPVPGAGSPASW